MRLRCSCAGSAVDLGEERRAPRRGTRRSRGRDRRRPRRRRSTASRRRAPCIAACAARTRQSSGVPVSCCSVIARRRYMWASCSHVNPMPPSVCTQSLAFANAASNASDGRGRDRERPAPRRRRGRRPRPPRPTLRRGRARRAPASPRSGASRPGTGRSGDRTARAPSRTRPRCRHTTARRRRLRPRTASPRATAPSSVEVGELAVGCRRGRGCRRVGVDAREPAGEVDALHFLRADRRPRRARTTLPSTATTITSAAAPPATRVASPSATAPVSSPATMRGSNSSAAGAAVGLQQRGDDRGRNVRTGRARATELLDHHGLLDEPDATPPVRLGDVETDPTRLRQRRPERRAVPGPSPPARSRRTAGRMRSSTKRRTAVRRCSWSSVIPIGIRR